MTGFGIALGTACTAIKPSYAEEDIVFYCGTHIGIRATIASTRHGQTPVVFWVDDYFSSSGYPPERRCQEATRRFQMHHDAGNLQYVTIITLDRQPVVCAAREEGGDCVGVLFTLPPGSDPDFVLPQSLASRNRIYVNINEYLSTPIKRNNHNSDYDYHYDDLNMDNNALCAGVSMRFLNCVR
ncbi:MAG: hypothetical protein F6J93_36650 [Oscillatoria sp. SIO1A7]|nr:hypothetical protein [Oscillatoria sp. SIO1A7]